MKKFFILMVFVTCLFSSCAKHYPFYSFQYSPNSELQKYLDMQEDTLEYSDNLQILRNSAPASLNIETVEYISGDIASILLYAHYVGVYDKTYQYPTVDNPVIVNAEWKLSDSEYDDAKGTVLLITADEKKYEAHVSSPFVDDIMCITDNTVIFHGHG